MQQEQDQTDDQDNVDEAGGYMKCEKSEQPKHDENRSDYPKHFFISLPPGAGTSARLKWRGSRMIEAVRKNRAREAESFLSAWRLAPF
jgi:hypothetical protein